MTAPRQIALFLAALVLLAVLFLAGRNLLQEARRGPRWKRRLVELGLTWLAILGLQPACRPKSGQEQGHTARAGTNGRPTRQGRLPPRQAGDRSGDTLRASRQPARKPPPRAPRVPGWLREDIPKESREWAARIQSWKDVTRVFREATKVAESPPGSRPLDYAAKWKLLLGLDRVKKVVREMAQAHQFTSAEAAFLVSETDNLRRKVATAVFRPPTRVTCYRPVAASRADDPEAEELEARLKLLQKVVAQHSVDRRVVDLVREEIESELRSQQHGGLGKKPRLQRLRNRFRRLWKRLLRKRRR